MRKVWALVILFLIFNPFSLYAAVDLTPIVVQKNNSSKKESSSTIASELNSFSGVDLKERSSFGVQQDLSIRGSGYQSSNVLIEGISVKDPQTGHFSLEAPFVISDLKKTDTRDNRQELNFVLKDPLEKGGLIKSSWGEHALFRQILSVNFPVLGLKNRISFENKKSKGARKDTDFNTYKLSVHSLWKGNNKEVEFFSGFLRKDFGANGFYAGPVYDQEEEHIRNYFVFLKTTFDNSDFQFKATPFYRRHWDKFILDRKDPSFYTNYHTNYVYGINNRIFFKRKRWYCDFNLKEEKISSTNLGYHERQDVKVGGGIERVQYGDFFLKGSFHHVFLSGREGVNIGSMVLEYNLTPELRLNFLGDRIYRKPSFTELYYSSPSNVGNPNLDVQKANNYEVNIEYVKEDIKGKMSFFRRNEANGIDWARNSKSASWEARNIGGIRTIGAKLALSFRKKGECLKEVKGGYTFLKLDKEIPFSYSKYRFNFLVHKFFLRPSFYIGKLIRFNPSLIFEKPHSAPPRAIVNLEMNFKIKDGFDIFIKADNIFNWGYSDHPGISTADSWWRVGAVCKF